MSKTDQIKSLAVALEEKDNQIKLLLAQQGNHEVQISEYSEIVKELTKKLENYEKLHGTVFRPHRK
tara:strand:- start:329 stop:526 length:198 start_codon:yes stop_codon:yes gene_type:complete